MTVPGGRLAIRHVLKRGFCVTALAVQVGIVGLVAASLAEGGDWRWLGAAAGPVALFGLFARLHLVREPAPTSADVPWVPAAAAAGAIVAAAASPWGAAAGAIGFAVNLAYVVWYSRLPRPESRLVVGQTLPVFQVQDLAGAPFRSTQLRGRWALILFYRGNWNPACRAWLRGVAARHADIASRGATVVCVSPQPPGRSEDLAREIGAPMRFLADPRNAAARDLGIDEPLGVPLGVWGVHADTVLPTAVVVDSNHNVVYLGQADNDRERPDPAIFLEVLDTRA